MKDKPPDTVIDFRAADFRKFRERLEVSVPAISDAEFADVIYEATTRWGVTEQAFRDTFGLTSGAVDRWTTLKNLPQEQIRPIIFKWIKEKVESVN